jgi:DNA adenine methylase
MRLRRFDPVLKWAGGKRQLLPQILERLPAKIATYYEPFVGGGAVFFALAHERRFERAVLSDQNRDLIAVYKALQSKNFEAVIEKLGKHERKHCEKYYYEVREERPRDSVSRAARMIYLNKTGFNGLYRVNSSGKFNVPFGRYEKPRILDEARLRAAHEALEDVEIKVSDFADTCKPARAGDAVYLDPPYLPVSVRSHFAEYHESPFGIAEHERLAKMFGKLCDRGVHVVLSNSETEDTVRLFKREKYDFKIVPARRSINSDKSGRGPVGEILVSTRSA